VANGTPRPRTRVWSEIADREFEPPLHLTIGVLGETDRAQLSNPFRPRGNVDAVTHEVAAGLLDNVAQMDTNAKLDVALSRNASVALDHAVLHFDRAAPRVDRAEELCDEPVARALDDRPVIHSDGGIDEIATEAPQARQGAILVRPGESAVPDHVGNRDCSELACFPIAHLLGVTKNGKKANS
jgi:hypothetical protein